MANRREKGREFSSLESTIYLYISHAYKCIDEIYTPGLMNEREENNSKNVGRKGAGKQ